MPAWKSLGDDEIAGLARYVASLGGEGTSDDEARR
jgi:mono/diheme cytochrome c family protein